MKTNLTLIAFAILFSGCLDSGPSPTPSTVPSEVAPSPSPSASASPAPVRALVTSSANVADEYRPTAVISLAENETRGIWLKTLTDECLPVVPMSGAQTALFKAPLMTFAKPSYIGAPTSGRDRLEPTDMPCEAGLYFLDVKGQGVVAVGNVMITLVRNSIKLPTKPWVPLYIGLNPSGYSRLLGVDSAVSKQGPVVAAAVALMRAHLAEPFSQYITTYPKVQGGNILLDDWKEWQGSFRQLVLDGAIAPPCLVQAQPPAGGDTLSDAYLSAVQTGLRAGTLPVGSWGYGWDEDQLGAPGQALARINRIKSLASLLAVRATREQDDQFTSVDSFIPLIDWFRQPGHVQVYRKDFGLYTSCMAQGSCSGPVRNPSGAPMLVADAAPVHALAFPVMAAALGASHSLYYSATEAIGTGLNYVSNGNGDGQLLYVGAKTVYPSVRLKLLREGMFMAEYYRLKPAAFAGLIQSGVSFSHDYAAFQGARDRAQ